MKIVKEQILNNFVKLLFLVFLLQSIGCVTTGKWVTFNELPLPLSYSEKEYDSIWYVNIEYFAGNYTLKPKDAADLWRYYSKYPNSDFAKFLQEKTRWQISENSIKLDTKLPYGIIPKGDSLNYSKYRIEEKETLDSHILIITEATLKGVLIYQFDKGVLVSKETTGLNPLWKGRFE